jgi:hypothetical protein
MNRELANSPSPRERRQLAAFVETAVLNNHPVHFFWNSEMNRCLPLPHEKS